MTGYALPGFVYVRQVRADLVGKRVIARHRITRRFVSVTHLSRDFLADVEFRTRFAAQAGRLTQVRDARVARLRQFVVSGDHAAVVADHVDGTPLRALLIEEGAIAVEAAVVVLKDAVRGLAASHAMGVAHGDVKPENVFLTRSGCIRLVDFGLSTCDSRRLLAWSTPFYLAPEQWRGGPATPAGDVYAATVTFFECLVGAPPFHADSPAGLSVQHEYSAPPLDAVPEPVRQLVARGLTKDLASRPSARGFLARVDEVASHVFEPGWERRGRRELTRLLTSSSHLPSPAVLAGLSDSPDRIQRPPIRFTAALSGALVMAAGLTSPPLSGGLPSDGSDVKEGPPAETSPRDLSPDGSEGDRPGTESQVSVPAPDTQSVAMAEPVASTLTSAVQPETMVAAAPLSGPVPQPVASTAESVPAEPSAIPPETMAQPPSTPAPVPPASEEPVPAQPMSAPPPNPGTTPGSEQPTQCAEEPDAVLVQEPFSDTGFPWEDAELWNEESMELTPSIPEWSTGHEEHDGSPFGDMGW